MAMASTALALFLVVPPLTCAALTSPTAAASVVATSCAVGMAMPGSPLTCVLVPAQLGAVAYLVSWGAGRAGLDPSRAAILAAVLTVTVVVLGLQAHRRAAGPTPSLQAFTRQKKSEAQDTS